MRGRTGDGLLVYATGYGVIDWAAEFELCAEDLIKEDLLPAPGEPEGPVERASLPANQAIKYLIDGVPVEAEDWTPEMVRETERGEIKLGELIGNGAVPAKGRRTPDGPLEDIPAGDFHPRRVTTTRTGLLPATFCAHRKWS
jgi:hypothetical protein